MATSQFTSPIRPFPSTTPPDLASNIATKFLSWLHTNQATPLTPYPILTLTILTSPNPRPPNNPHAEQLNGSPYQPDPTPLPSCPSFLTTKGYQIMVTTKRPCTPSYNLSEPPLLVFPITMTHPTSLNHLSTSPLTTTRRPMQMPPLPNLTNPTSLPCTLTYAWEVKLATLSLTELNYRSTNFA